MTHKKIHCFENDLLLDHDAVALASMVKRGDVSRDELARAAAARVEKVNGVLNAVEVKDYEGGGARSAGNTGGLFEGVPSFIKDNTEIMGLPTRHGSSAVPAAPARSDGPFARQYLSMGFTILGKTALPEFGFNCTTEYNDRPPARNPWNTGYSCGGSSGGAAALVAAGAVPAAHANDGGGSIRIPAACCGLVGLKPTRGRLVNGNLARMLPVNIVAEGVLTRTVRDTAYFYAGAEAYRRNPGLPAIGLVEGPGTRRLKIGLIIDSLSGTPTCSETRKVVGDTAKLLENMGHHVEEMPLHANASFVEDFSDYWAFLAYMASRFGKLSFGRDFDAGRLDGLTMGLAGRFSRRKRRLPLIIFNLMRSAGQYAAIMKNYDLILSPVVAHVTPELEWFSPVVPFDILFQRMINYVSFTPLNNANGSPAISLPMGMSSAGLPVGVQFAAAHGDEHTLLEIAYEIEAVRPWQRISGKPGPEQI